MDEEFRNAIALLSDSPRLTGPAVRSILKYKKEFDRVSLDEIGRRGISFETQNLIDYLKT